MSLSVSLLAVRDLTKSFGGVAAVNGVSFNVAEGELLALIGPNGAGKSTCFNCINGQLKADGGSVMLGDAALTGRKPRDIWRLGVGRTFQIAATFGSMSVRENVQMALLSHHRQLGQCWAPLARLHAGDAMALLSAVGVAELAEQACATLAYGDIKAVELAIALAHGPRLLLMDEPTAGMAPEERHALVALVKRLVRERSIGVLFTEHSMDVVFAFADRIVVMARGKVIAEGPPAQIRDDPLVREVYFGAPGALAEAVA